MSILDDFKVFRDRLGLNQLQPNETSQNGTLFTVEYLICLMGSGLVSQEEINEEAQRVRKAFFPQLERYHGLSVRFPESGEYESMDNTCALVTFSALFDNGEYSERMCSRGEQRVIAPDEAQDKENNTKFFKWAKIASLGLNPKWVFNNQNPMLFCLQGWFGRSPAMVGLIKMTAGRWVNPFLWISVMVGQFLGCFQPVQDTDARKLSYVNWQYLKTRSWIWRLAYKAWCWKLMKDYPEGMKSVYEIYYGNPSHPIRKYSVPFVP
jgi:hypothetical protein